MRKSRGDFVRKKHSQAFFDMNFVRVNCGDVFLEKLKGVVDPEQKKNYPGTEFLMFLRQVRKQDELGYLHRALFIPTVSNQ